MKFYRKIIFMKDFEYDFSARGHEVLELSMLFEVLSLHTIILSELF